MTNRTNIVKDEQGALVVDSHRILDRRRNYFSQILNVDGVNDVRQTIPEPSVCEIESAVDNLKITNHQILIKYKQN
jgi:hypothetical protein